MVLLYASFVLGSKSWSKTTICNSCLKKQPTYSIVLISFGIVQLDIIFNFGILLFYLEKDPVVFSISQYMFFYDDP